MMPEPTAIAQSSDPTQGLDQIAEVLGEIERDLLGLESEMSEALAAVPSSHRQSAKNLVHYVALRHRDLRELQAQLAQRGLSSLGRSESYVMGALLQVATRTHESLAVRDPEGRAELERLCERSRAALSWETAQQALHRHTVDIFGPRPSDRHVYVMVTAPSAEEADREWMVRLLEAGMNVLRINCAHETEAEWAKIIDALARARHQTGKPCRVLMDLAGPKIRTGTIKSKRRVATWKPQRDDIGKPTAPARVVIRRALSAVGEGEPAALLIGNKDFSKLRVADELRFRDARDKSRTLIIEELDADRAIASALERAYILGEADVQVRRGKKHKEDVTLAVGDASDVAIDVRAGDTLLLTKRDVAGVAPERDQKGRVETPGVVACTLPEALDHLEVGHRVLFDDGKIHAVVERVKSSGDFSLRVLRTDRPTSKLRAEKGINLPDTRITVPALCEEDRRALAFVVTRADAVSLSFVRSVEDIRALHEELAKLGNAELGIVLKIETRAGFENLASLLLEGLRRPPLAVMIARGDLAVEVGFERLAELQDEILWLCEAAHVPAIWATQVLDTLARTGVPSRAEVTDASASVAAECVMLNKGTFIHEAVSVLSGILRRMEHHRYKKRSLFRKLEVSTFQHR
ncbi:MAG TPA: pyruvate kinase [Polyangiaceae bacterium]|nr:pyruvate kinase [Polyangiaceae bacterium]